MIENNIQLIEKWAPMLENDAFEGITDTYRKSVTAQLLENQERLLAESSLTGDIDKYDPVLMSMVRRMAPKLIGYDVMGLQPMTMPTGLIFALRSKYATGSWTNKDGTSEAMFDEANTAWSGTGTHAGANPFDAVGSVTGFTITNYGAGYTGSVTCTIAAPAGGGTTATATPVKGGVAGEQVIGFIITNPGSGYAGGETPAVTFTGTNTTAAVATAVVNGAYSTGTAETTATMESDTSWNAMGFTIEKTTATAKERQLRADLSPELAYDYRAVHGGNADEELSNILSTQIVNEINRECVRTIYTASMQGAQFATTPGTFNLTVDADGRWSVEKFKGLLFALEREANAVAYLTKRGKGNILITSADVASALVMAGVLVYNPSLNNNLEVDTTGVTYAGKAGRFSVYVDPYLSADGYVVGYKGASSMDAGIFYCPYVPLQMFRGTDPTNFHQALGFKTRYAIVKNPFATGISGNNQYYRKAKVANLSALVG